MSSSAVILFLATALDEGCVKDSVQSGVLAPPPLCLVKTLERFHFSQIFRSTAFDAAPAYVSFCRTYEIDWHSVQNSCYLQFFLSDCKRRTIFKD